MRNQVIFVSHGSPTLVFDKVAAHEFLSSLGAGLERPKAILCVSAHWDTPSQLVSGAAMPETIHDFGGFPDELYQLRYPAPGSPQVAERISRLLNAAGLANAVDNRRGLDHGAWVPLMLMYPGANIPVVQLSVQSHLPASHSLAVGRALRPLRHEGVLIVASGSATHNLAGYRGQAMDAPVESYASAFEQWLVESVEKGDENALVNYLKVAPHARRNHPTADHYVPLVVAQGAAGDHAQGKVIHRSFTLGILSMAAFMWPADGGGA